MALKDIKPVIKTYPALDYRECYAKSKQSGDPSKTVLEHSLDAANVASVIAMLYENYDFVVKWGKILASVHDTGKISPGFQKKYFRTKLYQKIPELSKTNDCFEDKHAEISDSAVRYFLGEFIDNSASGEIAGIHHGRYNFSKQNSSNLYGGERWADERVKFIEEMVAKYGSLPGKDALSRIQQAVLAGFVCISDWISSDENLSCGNEEIAKESISKCGFLKPKIRKDLSFLDVFGFKPNDTQKKFIDSVSGPGVYVLESSTGSGKTEAAFYAAYKLMCEKHNNGIYFALPTRLTSDRIHGRFQKLADNICEFRTPVMLAHGSAWLNDEVMKLIHAGGEEMAPGGSWFTPRKRTLLAPFGVGTVDQALMAVMNVKHYFVRAFGLLGKVVILDEVHSYDIYTGTILDKLVEFLRGIGCSVIILSATLTKDRKKQFFISSLSKEDSYPLISIEHAGKMCIKKPEFSEKDKMISISFNYSRNIDGIVGLSIDKANSGQCVLWINNTVADSQFIYNRIAGTMKEKSFELGLLHSRFTVADRREKEDQWMKKLGKNVKEPSFRPKGCILVATQVVEQSVDIDADFMISELAPMDMLVQRLGRLWRHKRKNRTGIPEMLVTTGNLENANEKEPFIEALGKNNSKVYAPYILWKTWDALKSQTCLKFPSQIRTLLESVYTISDNEPTFVRELRKEMERKAKDLQEKAGGALSGVSLPTTDDDENAQTRYSEIQNIDCLLLRNVESKGNSAVLTLFSGEKLEVSDLKKNLYLSRQLHKNAVQVARYNFPDCDIQVPRYLKNHFFGQLAVLIVGEDGCLSLNDKPTQLFYNENIGVHKKDASVRKYDFKTGECDYELDNGWMDSGCY
ncbi:MAG TPA: CRISPR-associated helicase Cas3' [Victivallales bacterium]|nr:CRISPR-associated helicase Cas3' [Victivallales bacterium]